jgi:hypothetical protein
MKNDLLKSILDDDFLEILAKSADLYKIGSNSILDPEEIRIGLKVVPRAVMSMLISELEPMELNSHKEIQLPFGKMAKINVNKNAADDYTGSVYDNNKLVYDFKNRSIPGLGIILLSTFELYNMEELSKPKKVEEDLDRKVQKLIDERMELHSLVNRVVEDKMAQREAIHKLMMVKLNEAIKTSSIATPIMTHPVAIPSIATKPLDIKPSDITKKEAASKKGSPLKGFLERKKKPKEYDVEIAKSESANCPDCGQVIYGMGVFSCCICYGTDQNRKIWLKKSDDGIKLKFSRSWSPENIEMLLEVLRGRK